MPKEEKEQQSKIGLFRRIASRIQGNADDLYRTTYYTSPEDAQALQSIKKDITNSIKDIMDQNSDNIGEPNISKLYERLFMKAQNDPGTLSDFEAIFGDNEFVNTLTNSYLDNRWVKAIDREIDEVLKYMPKLHEALLTIRDNVLSADSFSKDYLNLEETIKDTKSKEQFAMNIEDMKTKYDLLKLTEQIYDQESKYGEIFIYCVPYTKAIQRLMDRKDTLQNILVNTNYQESTITISESATSAIDTIDIPKGQDLNLNLQFSLEEGIISSVVQAEYDARTKRQQVMKESLTEQYFAEQGLSEGIMDVTNSGRHYSYNNTFNNDIEMGSKLPVHHNFDHTLDDHLELPGDEDSSAAEGLTDKAKVGSKIKDMNGCIVKVLKRERITPIILNDICLGYYYFELNNDAEIFEDKYHTTGMVNTITGLRSNGRSEAFDAMQRREELLRSIANSLAEKIDTKFVNDNQDLKKEIYYILKYNDSFNAAAVSSNNIRVSYISPDDVHHFYFNLDEDTGRGISDLQLSLIPAKLWVAIYITNCLAIMTRGNDKRVYHVKQSVETNISKTLLKTINEIKKSNFGVRQIENINSVLNITGRFNDYIIPRGSDGSSPVEFEVMPGQQIEIKTDLLNLLEESAIDVTGVPMELIQSRHSMDYAIQYTMSNSKFLRFVYSRQSDFQQQLAEIYTKIYNIEYGTQERITVTLPPPLFINVTNTNQLIMNTTEYCNNIVEMTAGDSQDEVFKAIYGKKLKLYYLGSYVNLSVINDLMNQAKQETMMAAVTNPENIEQEE